jgi:hypothetical protein
VSTHQEIPMRLPIRAAWLALACAPIAAMSKPIAFQDGWTVMAEHGTDTMREAQVFYAPKYWWSAGVSATKLEAADRSFERELPGVQVNYLVKRWNLPAAQANVFTWAGLASARGFDADGERFSGVAAQKLGAQADYETRSVYASAKTDWFHSSRFTHRVDTLQLGVAPYEHDYDELAVWFLVQARRINGGLQSGTEWIPMVRLFKRNFWIEGGANRDGRAQLMVMMNF